MYHLRGTTRVSISFPKRDLNFTNATSTSSATTSFSADVDVKYKPVPILLNQIIL